MKERDRKSWARRAWKLHRLDVAMKRRKREFRRRHQGIPRRKLGSVNLARYSPSQFR